MAESVQLGTKYEVGNEDRKEGFYHYDTYKGRRKRELVTSG